MRLTPASAGVFPFSAKNLHIFLKKFWIFNICLYICIVNKTQRLMTLAQLSNIAKANKINLNLYDKVFAFIGENYKFIVIKLYNEEGVGTARTQCNIKYLRKNILAITKKGEELPEDYETEYPRWITDLR